MSDSVKLFLLLFFPILGDLASCKVPYVSSLSAHDCVT